MSSAGDGDRVFHRIGAVAEQIGVAPHVIRYWEQELPLTLSERDRNNVRMYGPKHLERLARVRQLILEQGMSVRKLRRIIQSQGFPAEVVESKAEPIPIQEIVDELKSIAKLLR